MFSNNNCCLVELSLLFAHDFPYIHFDYKDIGRNPSLPEVDDECSRGFWVFFYYSMFYF